MTHSNANETITLLEGARSLVTDNQSIFGIPGAGTTSQIRGETSPSLYESTVIDYPHVNTFVKDETIIILDRLKELTQKTIHLEVSSKYL